MLVAVPALGQSGVPSVPSVPVPTPAVPPPPVPLPKPPVPLPKPPVPVPVPEVAGLTEEPPKDEAPAAQPAPASTATPRSTPAAPEPESAATEPSQGSDTRSLTAAPPRARQAQRRRAARPRAAVTSSSRRSARRARDTGTRAARRARRARASSATTRQAALRQPERDAPAAAFFGDLGDRRGIAILWRPRRSPRPASPPRRGPTSRDSKQRALPLGRAASSRETLLVLGLVLLFVLATAAIGERVRQRRRGESARAWLRERWWAMLDRRDEGVEAVRYRAGRLTGRH